MLMPRKFKHRREFRGRRRGTAKGQSTVQFGDYGISVAFAMVLKPGGQVSVIRRKALAMLRASFAENGIGFASPTIQVAGQSQGSGDESAAAAALAAAKRAADIAPPP